MHQFHAATVDTLPEVYGDLTDLAQLGCSEYYTLVLLDNFRVYHYTRVYLVQRHRKSFPSLNDYVSATQ